MIEFFNRLFGRQTSGATAKERLRLVLMSDHLSLAPEMIDAMKRDLVDVISRYVEVDREKIEVNFEQQDKALAMLANIPILSVNRPNGNGAAKDVAPSASTPLETGSVEGPPAAPVAAAPNVVSPGAQAALADLPSRRRRRRRKAQSLPVGAKPATTH